MLAQSGAKNSWNYFFREKNFKNFVFRDFSEVAIAYINQPETFSFWSFSTFFTLAVKKK